MWSKKKGPFQPGDIDLNLSVHGVPGLLVYPGVLVRHVVVDVEEGGPDLGTVQRHHVTQALLSDFDRPTDRQEKMGMHQGVRIRIRSNRPDPVLELDPTKTMP